MRLVVPSAMLVLLLAGCGRAADAPAAPASPAATLAPPPAASPPPVPQLSAHAAATATSGDGRKVEQKTDAYDFGFAYPAKAGDIPALKAALDRKLAKAKDDLVADASAAQAAAQKGGYPFNAYSSDKTWQVVTDLPGWLSLSATLYTYTGGAHGMTVFDTLLWDKRANAARVPLDLFASKAAFSAAVAKPLCNALNRERAKRRSGDLGPADAIFSKCVDPIADAEVILGSGDRQHFTRIGFLIPAYNAGPYSEGAYKITIPVTAAVLAAVKPAYRATFAVR